MKRSTEAVRGRWAEALGTTDEAPPSPDRVWSRHRRGKGRTCGRIATYNAGCRCVECTRACRDKKRAMRARKREAMT